MENKKIIINNLIEIEYKIQETAKEGKIKQDLKLEITEHNEFFTYQIVREDESLLNFLKREKLKMESKGFDVVYIGEKLEKLLKSRQFRHFQNKFYCLTVEYPELKDSDIMLSQSFKNKLKNIFFYRI